MVDLFQDHLQIGTRLVYFRGYIVTLVRILLLVHKIAYSRSVARSVHLYSRNSSWLPLDHIKHVIVA